MAVTQEDLKKAALKPQNQSRAANTTAGTSLAQTSPQGGQTNLAGVSQSTQAGLQAYGKQYTPSAAVTEAQQYLQSVIDKKPGDYQSDYQGQIADLYERIMNRPKFSYDVNKDPLFQGYKNQYVQQGQRAMQDTVGNLAALTGGYGNSWAGTVGSQAYQYYLQQLNDRVPELEQRAFDRYTAEGDQQRNNMELASSLDEIAYGRHRDAMADWQTERNFANERYGQERTWDQNDVENMRNYYQQLAQMENSSYWQGENLEETKRQFDIDETFRRDQLAEQASEFSQSLAEQIRQADLLDERERNKLAEQARQFDANLAENIRQFDTSFAENQRQFDLNFAENQRQFNVNEAFRRDQLAEQARQFDANLAEEIRQADLLDERERNKLAEQARQFDANLAENIRQFDQTLAEDQRQYDTTFAENQRLADLDEAYRQAQLAESIRQYDTTFGENQRQYDTSLAEKQREFDIAQALDQAEYDFKVRKYEDALAQAAGSGNGGYTPSTTPETPQDENQETSGWFSRAANKIKNGDLNDVKNALAKFGLGGQSNTEQSIWGGLDQEKKKETDEDELEAMKKYKRQQNMIK